MMKSKEELMYEEIKNCTECKIISEKNLIADFIQENGECIIDEKSSGEKNGRFFTEGNKEYEFNCSSCKAIWIWKKHWITDNGGEGISRNGISFNN